MLILIPTYEPGARLAPLVQKLLDHDPSLVVVVVDDGSGPAYAPIFEELRAVGAEVLTHPLNRGKGAALRTGFRHALDRHPGQDVVTADSDGQHRVADILLIAETVRHDGALVVGGRRFTGSVPVRSKVGNAVARAAFRAATGLRLHDTQSGLRGVPAGLLPGMLDIRGDRFEYELSQLLECGRAGRPIREVPIATVYLDQNASSHFRPIVDSARVLAQLGGYLAVSLGSFVLDTVALQILVLTTGALLPSMVIARILSGTTNFLANRQLVFRSAGTGDLRRHAARYLVLAFVLLAAGYAGIAALTALGLPLLVAKVTTDATLAALGFLLQRALVFGGRRRFADASPPRSPEGSSAPVAEDRARPVAALK